MEKVREYIIGHPEITGGRFSWYDLIMYHGIAGGQHVHIGARVLGEDISIDTDDRAALIAWTKQVDGFGRFFTDPEKVRREYTSEDGRRLIVTYYRDQDTENDSADDDIYLSPDPENQAGEFASYEDFKAAAAADLEAEGYIYEFAPEK